MNKIFGIVFIFLALAIAIVPTFTDCQSQGKSLALTSGKTVPMKCHWTGVAEIVTGVPLVAVGVMMAVTRKRTNLFSLGVMGVVLGIMAILLPTSLIGVCQTPTMTCHTVMRPALMVLGSVVIAGSREL